MRRVFLVGALFFGTLFFSGIDTAQAIGQGGTCQPSGGTVSGTCQPYPNTPGCTFSRGLTGDSCDSGLRCCLTAQGDSGSGTGDSGTGSTCSTGYTCSTASNCASGVFGGPCGTDNFGICCKDSGSSTPDSGATGSVCYGSTSGYQGSCKVSQNCDAANRESASGTFPCNDGLICCVVKGGGSTPGGSTPGGSVPGGSTPGGSTPGGAYGSVSCPGGVVRGGICFPATGLSQAPIFIILSTFMNWLLGIFGMIAIIAFVISGLQYLLAAGDESLAETAKRNMKYSIIGIVVALSGWIIINAITNALSGWGFLY